jgi:hypothetical protein
MNQQSPSYPCLMSFGSMVLKTSIYEDAMKSFGLFHTIVWFAKGFDNSVGG